MTLNVFKVYLPNMALIDDCRFTTMNMKMIVMFTSAFPKVTCNFMYPIRGYMVTKETYEVLIIGK